MKRILAATALAALSVGASAQVTVMPGSGTATTIVGTFDPTTVSGLSFPSFTQVARGAIVMTTAGNITATFVGKEANDTDTFAFTMGGATLFNNIALLGTSTTIPIGAGTVGFTFADMTSGMATATYGVLGSYSGSVFTPYSTSTYQLFLAFNDGLNVDGDYDDMIVGLSVTAVPEPETYALMLAGIGAVGFIARRRRKTFGA